MISLLIPSSMPRQPRRKGCAGAVLARMMIAICIAANTDGFNSPSIVAHSRRLASGWSESRDRRKICGRPVPMDARSGQRDLAAPNPRRKRNRVASIASTDSTGDSPSEADASNPGVNGHVIVTPWYAQDGERANGVDHEYKTNAPMEDVRESMEAAAKQSVPLKVMVFIDGTWLYYSFFGRGERCHVSAKLGPGWYYDYLVKWEMLPVIISRALHAQLAKYNQSSRLVEVVRTVVFSSARSDTDKDSYRMQMFESMREKNFEVHMATTMGVQEKCIDIALAVEMMHYATIPDTYDVGVLVTGDKDFMPAMSRTRQKGRRVCLCSMRNSCNQDLLRDDAHVMDFPPVWINEYLDDLIEYAPASGGPGSRVKSRVPPEVICETITSLIKEEGGTISSRYLGRALHRTPVLDNGTTMLGVIKESWGSLTRFLTENDVFLLGNPIADPDDPNIKQFTISLVDRQNSMKSVKLGEVIEDSTSVGVDSTGYGYGAGVEDEDGGGVEWEGGEGRAETEESLSREKVPQLKERLRERGLPVSGNKAALIERLLASMESDQPPPPSRYRSATSSNGAGVKERSDELSEGWEASRARIVDASGDRTDLPGSSGRQVEQSRMDREVEHRQRRMNGHAALVRMVGEILDASQTEDGVVSSRDVGRELARRTSPDNPSQNALVCLKSRWPSLMAFLRACPSEFTVADIGEDREFGVFRTGRVTGGFRQISGAVSNGDGRYGYSSSSSISSRGSGGGGGAW